MWENFKYCVFKLFSIRSKDDYTWCGTPADGQKRILESPNTPVKLETFAFRTHLHIPHIYSFTLYFHKSIAKWFVPNKCITFGRSVGTNCHSNGTERLHLWHGTFRSQPILFLPKWSKWSYFALRLVACIFRASQRKNLSQIPSPLEKKTIFFKT